MWNDIVTLYIDDTSLRLLVCQGQTIKKSAIMTLEPGLIKGSVVLNEEEVVTKIKQLLQSQEVKSKKVILGFSGLHSLTRPATLPQLPKAMLPEAVVREARRVLPVPLDQLYLSWKIIPGPRGKTQIYIAATPRKTVDSLIKVVQNAGLEVSRLSIKPLALTKLMPSNTSILVDLQSNEFDIVIMVEGIAQPIRTISLPNEESTFEQKLNMIISELDRTIKFFDTNNPENTLDPKVPIYISGDLADKPNVQSSLSQKINHPVVLLTPGFKGTEQVEIQSYCVNTALAAKIALPGREATFPLADMNLLPILYQPKPISLVKILGIPGAIAIVALVIPMILMIQNVSQNIVSTQIQLDDTNKNIGTQTIQKNNLKKQVTELENQLNDIQTNNTKYQGVVDYLDSQHEQIKGDLIITLGKVNPEITLISITLSEGTLIVQGSAPNNEDVYTYAQNILQYARELDSSQRYSETTISSISVLPPPEISDNGSSETPISPETPAEGKIVFILTFARGGR
jgi:type IV pilus assembly protein PilM